MKFTHRTGLIQLLFPLFLIPLVSLPLHGIANDPCSAIPLSNNSIFFSTHDLTSESPSGISAPSCGTYNDPDIWFSFVAPPGASVTIEVKGLTCSDPAMAIYNGACSSPTEIICREDQKCGTDPNPGVTLTSLTPGTTYYIRVWSEAGAAGTFKIRITDPNASNFTNSGSAYNTSSNCVQLTPAQQTQKGCSWYNISIDFSLPFEMEFTLNFGTLDANGADGICMVYSTAPGCGQSGGGIGALGIPNSFIITFDTWQNAEHGDPPQDHTTFYYNGDFDIPIVGPEILGGGNVEDGADHAVKYIWDPATLNFSVYFDGVLTISKSNLDIVNNCFGGNTVVYWGLTASTGGSVNKQSFCYASAVIDDTSPQNDTINPNICEGKTFTSPEGNTFTQSGTYTETFIASNGCESVRTINLDVTPKAEKFIDAILCDGDVFNGGNGNNFSTTGVYTYNKNGNPCDTVVHLNLLVLDFNVFLDKTGDLDCNNSLVGINSNYVDNSGNPDPNYTIVYGWVTDVGSIVSGQGSPSIIVDKPGNYQLNLSITYSGKTCTFTSLSININEDKAAPTAIITQLQGLDCQNDLGTLSGTLSLTPPLTYEWFTIDGNIVGTDINNIVQLDKEGTYTLTVTSLLNGCIDTASFVVNRTGFNVNMNLSKDADINCKNDTVTLYASINPDNGLHYKWKTTNGNIIGIDTIKNIKVDKGGIYTFEIINGVGCSVTKTITVTENKTKPVVNAGSDKIITCVQASVPLTGTVSSPASKFITEWTSPDATISNPTQLTIQAMDPGIYIFTVIDTLNYCTASDTVLVKADVNRPDISINTVDTITCTRISINVSSSLTNPIPNAGYQWKTDSGNIVGNSDGNNILVDKAGIYTVIVVNPANNCIDSTEVEVVGSPDQPIASASADVILDCTQTTTSISATYSSNDPSSQIRLKWTTTDGTILGPDNTTSLNISDPGMYIFRVTNLINNCYDEDTVLVTLNSDKPLIILPQNLTVTCRNPQVDVIATWTNGGNLPVIKWSTIDGNILSNIDTFIRVNRGGTYLIEVENKTSGCKAQGSIVVAQNTISPPFTIQSPALLTCAVKQVTVSLQNTAPNYSFQWSTVNGNIISGGNSDQVTVDRPGIYFITVTDAENGCTAEQQVEVKSDIDVLTAMAGSDKTLNCKIKTILLDGSVNSGNVGLLVQWQTADGIISSGGSTLTPTVNSKGTYILHIINNTNGCEASDTVKVTEAITAPVINQLSDSEADCNDQGGSISFVNISGGPAPYEYHLNNQLVTPVNNVFADLKSGIYTLEIIDANGCSKSEEIQINKKAGITVSLPDTIKMERGDEYLIQPEFSIDTNLLQVLNWSGADYLDCYHCATPLLHPGESALLSIFIEDGFGCKAQAETFILVKKKIPHIFVPNVFTPFNRDGINDRVVIKTDGAIQKIDEFRIFNRWGAEVFSLKNFEPNDSSTGWDGSYRGKVENPGVFVYYLKCVDVNGDSILKKGDITILK